MALLVVVLAFVVWGPGAYSGFADEVNTPTQKDMNRADNDPLKKHSVSTYHNRISVDVGDQGGGPVRYNTRFPSDAVDPNPTSYYHTQAFIGLTGEFVMDRGALQLGVLARRDLAHRGIEGRTVERSGLRWRVDKFYFHSEAISFGWILGQMYQEAPWKVSLAGVLERASLTTTLEQDATGESLRAEAALIALSLRARAMFRLLGQSALDLHIGPEFHIPVYSVVTKPAADTPEREFADTAKIEHTGAVGLALEMGYRF